MRVFFVITGIGYGHSMREHAIINELVKKYPNVEIKVAGYDKSYEYFSKRFDCLKLKGWVIPDRTFNLLIKKIVAANFLAPLSYMNDYFRLRRAVKKFKPDLIVSDFEFVGVSVAKSLGLKHVGIFNFDLRELKRYKKSRKYPLNLGMQEKYVREIYGSSKFNLITSLKGNGGKGKYVYVNPIIRSGLKDLPSERVLMKKLGLKRRPILIEMGGTKFGRCILREMVKCLGSFKEDFLVFERGRSFDNVRFVGFKENYLEYLKVSKGLISLGGNTSLGEGLVFKKPMLLFPIHNHLEQLLNGFSLERLAVVKYLDRVDFLSVKEGVEEFVSSISLLKKKMSSVRVKGNGAKEVVDRLF